MHLCDFITPEALRGVCSRAQASEGPPESGEKGRMAPSTHPPLWEIDSGARERISPMECLL